MSNTIDDEIQALLDNNRDWAARMERNDPGFFSRLATQQKPNFLWIGCSDSRVSPNQITGLPPGELFVHRNVANIVEQTDINCMSVVDFAIRTLKVRHIIVCGHYGCSGVKAAMGAETEGVMDHWLSSARVLWEQHREELEHLSDADSHSRLCELNVRRQVETLSRATVVRQAWSRGQHLHLHGWIYGLQDGLLRDLGQRISGPAEG